MRFVAIFFALLMPVTALAQETQPTTAPSKDADVIPQLTLQQQATLEAQIGLRLYQEGEDYRAITAMHRYRILDGSHESAFLAFLITGAIYHRNEKPKEARIALEKATLHAKDDHARNLTFLMANQESCVGLSLYFSCAEQLDAFLSQPMDDATRELAAYQRMYVDVVLRSDTVTDGRASGFRDQTLRLKAEELVRKTEEFEDLPTKSPWAAGLLSAAIPGAGQLYNGRPVDALLAFGLTAGFGVATYLSITELESVPLAIVSGLFALSFYTGNIVNAVTDANRITANAYLTFFEKLQRSHWARVRFDIRENVVNFGYTFDLSK